MQVQGEVSNVVDKLDDIKMEVTNPRTISSFLNTLNNFKFKLHSNPWCRWRGW